MSAISWANEQLLSVQVLNPVIRYNPRMMRYYVARWNVRMRYARTQIPIVRFAGMNTPGRTTVHAIDRELDMPDDLENYEAGEQELIEAALDEYNDSGALETDMAEARRIREQNEPVPPLEVRAADRVNRTRLWQLMQEQQRRNARWRQHVHEMTQNQARYKQRLFELRQQADEEDQEDEWARREQAAALEAELKEENKEEERENERNRLREREATEREYFVEHMTLGKHNNSVMRNSYMKGNGLKRKYYW